jgi:hypothetical protein
MSNLDGPADYSVEPAGSSDEPDEAELNSRRLRAWMDVGATNLPALLVALGSAAVGGLAMMVRRRRTN